MEEKQSKEVFKSISENIFQVTPLLKKRLSRMSTFQSKYGLPMSHFPGARPAGGTGVHVHFGDFRLL